MVGEIRDGETARYAVQAALTGHLVLSTLHTNDAASAVVRLRDLGVPPFLISSTLLGTMAQRLVRRICPRCAEPEPLTIDQLAALGVAHPEDYAGKIPARVGRGCNKCRGTGYFGRTGIFELLDVSPKIRTGHRRRRRRPGPLRYRPGRRDAHPPGARPAQARRRGDLLRGDLPGHRGDGMSLAPTSEEVLRLWRAGGPTSTWRPRRRSGPRGRRRRRRALRGCRSTAWTATAGLAGRDDLASPEAALSAFAAGEGAALLLLHDLHRWLDDRRLVRQLRDLAPRLAAAGPVRRGGGPALRAPPGAQGRVRGGPGAGPGRRRALALLEAGGPIPAASSRGGRPGSAPGPGGPGAPRAVAMSGLRRGPGVHRRRRPVEVVLGEKRRHLRDAFALEVVRDRVGFYAVGGLEALKQWLSERAGAFTDEARQFGLPAPKGALLLGVQGCGKSLSAKAVADHWRLPLLRLDLAAIFGGDTAARDGVAPGPRGRGADGARSSSGSTRSRRASPAPIPRPRARPLPRPGSSGPSPPGSRRRRRRSSWSPPPTR